MDVPDDDDIPPGDGFTAIKGLANDPAWQGPAINEPALRDDNDSDLVNPDGSDIFTIVVMFNQNCM